jgi:hypothetical protein
MSVHEGPGMLFTIATDQMLRLLSAEGLVLEYYATHGP